MEPRTSENAFEPLREAAVSDSILTHPALTLRLMPRHMTLPKDVAVVHPSLASFDALPGVRA